MTDIVKREINWTLIHLAQRDNDVREGGGGSVVSDHGPGYHGPYSEDCRDFYKGELICESISGENARRIIALWNACKSIPTEEIEKRGLQLKLNPFEAVDHFLASQLAPPAGVLQSDHPNHDNATIEDARRRGVR